MCCSGNHHHNKETHQESVQEKSTRSNFHFPMMLCCLIPIIALFFLGSNGIGGTVKSLFPFLMIVFCLGSHFLMKGHSHTKNEDCCESEKQKN